MEMENDEWGSDERRLLSPEKLAAIAKIVDHEGPVIIEHRFYRGSRAPSRVIFDDHESVLSYLKSHANPGDAFYVWNYAALCRDDNQLVTGKWPDKAGRTPAGGAY
jgi:hypothetical protein